MATQSNTSSTGHGKIILKPYYVFKRLFTKTSVDGSPVPRPRKERKKFFNKTSKSPAPITPVVPVPVTAPIISAPIIVQNTAEHAAETDSNGIVEPFTPSGTQTTLSRILSTSPEYTQVASTFGIPNAKIMAIFSLEMPSEIKDAHAAHKEEEAGKIQSTPEAVTKRLFHGTKSTCDPNNLIKKGEVCGNVLCGLCGILKVGNKTTSSRCNGGMWFAQHANTSNGYTYPHAGTLLRVMYLVDVVHVTNVAYTVCTNKDHATLPRHLVIYKL
ncbi:11622_t:CDS:2 [Paraglomus brasilianum]|uniref:11622_t:CDS:1 n=1 Tax=Paraglomus brasilianum TaxID=144538 RepID=A0A9N9AP15_9GLOM|nr:11622_t:CDS:2 [Paraglomus brasilianum]